MWHTLGRGSAGLLAHKYPRQPHTYRRCENLAGHTGARLRQAYGAAGPRPTIGYRLFAIGYSRVAR
jgi:hypothetical protein